MQTTRIRALGASAALLAAAGGLLGTGGMASATTKPAPVDLTVVGSDTTQEVIGAVAAQFNSSAAAAKLNATATNVDAQPNPNVVAPSDANCNSGQAVTYTATNPPPAGETLAPNGSTAGRSALAASVSAGNSCVSVARSASPGGASDPAGTQAYAFALDAVTWSTLVGGDAPTNLSITQVEGIYDCTYTNWSQVGGANAPIDLYYPQAGAGIASFFDGVIGFDPRVLGGVNACAQTPTIIEQNEATAIPQANAAQAITIYSAGAWVAQANGVDADLRAGFGLGEINGTGSYTTGSGTSYALNTKLVTAKYVEPPYQPTNTKAVQGIHELFNFINTGSIDYKAAAVFVGAKSALCTNKDAALIKTYGFVPLKKCIEQS